MSVVRNATTAPSSGSPGIRHRLVAVAVGTITVPVALAFSNPLCYSNKTTNKTGVRECLKQHVSSADGRSIC